MECLRQGRAEEALELHTRALALREGVGDAFGVAMSSNAIGLVHLREHRLERARESLDHCLLLTREIGERRWEGIALGNLAAVELRLGRPRKAVTLAEWAVTIHRETHDRITEFATLACLGMAWRDLGDLESALGALHEALHAAGPGDLVLEAYALMQLGHVQSRRGEPEEALSLYHHAAALHRRAADHRREAECFEGVGRVYLALRRPEEASRFFDRAAAGYRGHGDRWRLAVCLDRWAVVSSELGDAERARAHRAEALDLLEGFNDPEAVSLRARLTDPSG